MRPRVCSSGMPTRSRTDRCTSYRCTVSGTVADTDATTADANTDSDSYGNCYSSGDSNTSGDIYSETCSNSNAVAQAGGNTHRRSYADTGSHKSAIHSGTNSQTVANA